MADTERLERGRVVVGVTGGIARCLSNTADGVDCLILDFDALDEYGDREERDHVERLLQERRYSEVEEYLADLDEDLRARV